ncbi:MAG: division/cell wall cluster transcriptional repressor MraZ [Ignavibacteria bacterium]|nr:division/cell wall cluster transcriptional repressor MraZ [Ignavibacteria bacterium]MBI3766703.1 division/cell wall cluster transcriptional repressor MraZ [Ignavibacteriales bacterium]
MSSFKGSYMYAVDDKGRVNLPAKLRKYVSPEANETFVITRGFEKCLFVYPVDEWNKLEGNLRNLSSYDPEHRRFIRALLELASESQLDGQARLSIPQELREYASIQDEVRIIGTLDKIELWDPKIYDDYKNTQPEPYESIAAKVMR